MADFPINDLTPRNRYIAAGGEDEFDYDFPIFDADHLLVQETDPDDLNTPVTLVRGVDYTVVGVNEETGGKIELDVVAYPTGATEDFIYTITRQMPLERLNDYQFSGDFESDDVNVDFDSVVMMIQQLDRDLQATPRLDQTDVLTTLPIKVEATADRQSRALIFNAAGTGLEAGPTTAALDTIADYLDEIEIVSDNIAAVNTVATNISNVGTVAGAIAAVNTVAGIAANVSTVAGISANVTTVAGISANVTSVAGNAANITAVAGNATNINIVAAADTDIDTVATNIADVNTCADNIAAIIAAPGYAAAAASAAAEGLYNDVQNLQFSDSPYVPVLSQEGTLFRVDTSGGNVVINLSTLVTYGEDMKFAFVKVTGDANTVTVNRGGSDTINASTSVVISTRYETHALIGDLGSSQWIDVVQTTGIPDGDKGDVTVTGSGGTWTIDNDVVTNAKAANMAANTIKANATGATADPGDLAIAANKFPARSSTGDLAAKDVTDFGLSLIDDADAATARATLVLVGRCQLRNSANQSIANSTDVLVAFNTENWDTDTFHDTVTNNSRITIPAKFNGRYARITGHITYNAVNTGKRNVTIRKNGSQLSTPFGFFAIAGNNAEYQTLEVNMTVLLATNDYFELATIQTSGGAVDLIANYSFFEIEILP